MTADEQLARASGEVELLQARLEGARVQAEALRKAMTAIEASITRAINALSQLRLSMEDES